jgi:hypothetical protein
MAKEERDERFERAVAALTRLSRNHRMSPSYEDGVVAGMMDFLHGWFSDDIYCATDDFGRGYACSCPSPIDHPLGRQAPIITWDFRRARRENEASAIRSNSQSARYIRSRGSSSSSAGSTRASTERRRRAKLRSSLSIHSTNSPIIYASWLPTLDSTRQRLVSDAVIGCMWRSSQGRRTRTFHGHERQRRHRAGCGGACARRRASGPVRPP